MEKLKKKRAASFAVIILVYILAAVVGFLTYWYLPFALWLNLLVADVVSTIIVFIFSLIFKNASVYDPYWSVQPVVIITAFALSNPMNFAKWLLLIAVWLWGIRLTGNWAMTFPNLEHQDWRYTMLKNKTGPFYWLVNLTGIHLFPTLVVYACVMPAVSVIVEDVNTTFGSVIFFFICIAAVLLELVADTQMHAFRRSESHTLIDVGLWKYARHPNYLGEILMWWGVALQALCVLPGRWWLLAGAVINTLMFLFVSIPMADKRQSAKPDYEEYMQRTNTLFPIKWFTGK